MKRLIYIFLACLCLVACHKGSTSRGFLANDLSYKLICPDSVPTDGVYSWWSESGKQSWIEYGNEPMEDEWFILPEPLGYRGADFQRFYIHYDTVYKVSDSIYHIDGRTRCKDEICTISGSLIVDSVVPYIDTLFSVDELIMITSYGTLYAHYTLQANHNDKYIADLVGKACFDYLIHNDTIYYDAIRFSGDGYCNNQYTGKWIYLDTQDTLTCNWGDFRIPESDRLDGGCGCFIPDEALIRNMHTTTLSIRLTSTGGNE